MPGSKPLILLLNRMSLPFVFVEVEMELLVKIFLEVLILNKSVPYSRFGDNMLWSTGICFDFMAQLTYIYA